MGGLHGRIEHARATAAFLYGSDLGPTVQHEAGHAKLRTAELHITEGEQRMRELEKQVQWFQEIDNRLAELQAE
jgi:hypothetical protein